MKLLRLREVIEQTGLSRSTIYAQIQAGRFPKPVRIGARAVAWVAEEVDLWIAERVEQSRRKEKP